MRRSTTDGGSYGLVFFSRVMVSLRHRRRNDAIMRPVEFNSKSLAGMLRKRKIATMAELMAALGSDSRSTVFRKLRELEYRTSYSHRGRFYALDEVAHFDEQGLWAHRDVRFSIHGTLMSTGAAIVAASDAGYFAEELDTSCFRASSGHQRRHQEEGTRRSVQERRRKVGP